MEFTSTLQNLCLNIIVDTVQDNRGFVEFHEALLSVKLPSSFHDAIISRNTAQIEDSIFQNYYENGYVHELGIDSDDPEF